jgi:tetratricopeptide (TPR) repeat protein
LWRAKAEAAIGKQKEAIIHCRRSCQCDPLYGPARAWLGGLLRSNSQYPAALISLDRALKIDPILAWAWAWRGEVLLRMGKVVDSLDSLRNALALDPMNSDAALWQAEGFAASGHYAAAEKFALKVIQVWPSHWRALALLSVLAGRSKRVKRQKYYLNRAFNAAPLHMKKHIEMQSHIHG